MIKSPCKNVCRYNKDMVCISCKRTLDEVGQWDKVDDKGKRKILDNIKERKTNNLDYYGNF